jgi:uncharacterized membrane protein YbhN (UPF0104 family)
MMQWSPSVRRNARVAGLIALTAILIASLRHVDWQRTTAALREGRIAWLAAAAIANSAILVCWAAYWRALRPLGEAPVPYARMFEIVSMSSSLMNTLPFGGGHASSVLLLMRRSNTTQRGALSTMALDQLGEGVAKLTILVAAGLVVPLPTWMRATLTTVSLSVGALFLTMMVASRWAKELEVLKSWRRSSTALGCVFAMKGVELLAIALVQRGYGVDVSAAGTLLVLATVIVATMLPISPGNVGTYEASVFLAYRYLGVAPEVALSLAIVQHVCFMLPAVGVGYSYLSAQALSRSAIASR